MCSPAPDATLKQGGVTDGICATPSIVGGTQPLCCITITLYFVILSLLSLSYLLSFFSLPLSLSDYFIIPYIGILRHYLASDI